VLRFRQSQLLSGKAGTKQGGAVKGAAKKGFDADIVLDGEVASQPAMRGRASGPPTGRRDRRTGC
jgi:hypothetical protein